MPPGGRNRFCRYCTAQYGNTGRHTEITHHDSALRLDLLFKALKNKAETDRMFNIYIYIYICPLNPNGLFDE